MRQESSIFVARSRKVQKRFCYLCTALLKEKGYNPINQIVGYLISGDPAYIPRHNNARALIRKVERDELIEELVKHYLKTHQIDQEES